MASIIVKHNIEVAHRLFETKGKCEAIHGHSMMVHLEIPGQLDKHGMLDGLEFGAVKKLFRGYLDENYDHHLLLNYKDPWARPLAAHGDLDYEAGIVGEFEPLPGLLTVTGDPTTENIARWVAEWGVETFDRTCEVIVEETLVNAATYIARSRTGGR